MTPELLKNAQEVIARTKADHLLGKLVPGDQMLAFALADALVSTAAEIERLRAANRALVEALEALERDPTTPPGIGNFARLALARAVEASDE